MARPLPIRRDITQGRAQELRRNLAPAEQLLWSVLRNRRLGGLKFRRQYPIGPYIADFYCREVKLIIELDGDSHDNSVKKDAERTRYLESHHLTVFRVQNADVFSNLEAVAFGILRATGVDVQLWMAERERTSSERRPPHPSPLPRRRGRGDRNKGEDS